jgi:hypothetical protein
VPGAAPAQAAIFCGKTVTSDVTLRHDLDDCPGDGLVAGANGVRIDLDGHTIDGQNATDTVGVHNPGFDSVVVKGPGRVTQFDDGISYQSTVGGRIRGVSVRSAYSPGVNLQSGNGTKLIRSSIRGSEGYGVSVVHCVECEVVGNVIQGPAASALSSYGLAVSSSLSHDNLIKGNLIRAGAESDFGMLIFGSADHTRIKSNVIRGRNIFSEGLSVYDGAVDTLVKNNVARNSLFNGIDVESGAGSGSAVGGNLALNNGNWGISTLGSGATDLGGNRAAGNGQAAQCVGVVCSPP